MLHTHDEQIVTGWHACDAEHWVQHFLCWHLNIKEFSDSDTSRDGGTLGDGGGEPSGDEGVGSVGEGANDGEEVPARSRQNIRRHSFLCDTVDPGGDNGVHVLRDISSCNISRLCRALKIAARDYTLAPCCGKTTTTGCCWLAATVMLWLPWVMTTVPGGAGDIDWSCLSCRPNKR